MNELLQFAFIYIYFWFPFFFGWEGDLDLVHSLSCPKTERGKQSAERSRKEEDRAEAEKPEERRRGDISLRAVPPSGFSARYQEAAESAW